MVWRVVRWKVLFLDRNCGNYQIERFSRNKNERAKFMKKIVFPILVLLITSQYSKAQVVPDSLKGFYSGITYWKYSDVTTWSLFQADSEYVSYIDPAYCTSILSGALASWTNDTTPFWTDHSFCNSVYAPPTYEFTGFVFPKFFSMDSIRVFAVVPRPYPYSNRIHYLFLGKRISADYTLGAKVSTQNVSLKVFPNPATSTLNIECPQSQHLNVSLFNLIGEQVIQKDFKGSKETIDISALPAGMYFINIENERNVIIKKIIKL